MDFDNRETKHANKKSSGFGTGGFMLSATSMVGNNVVNKAEESVGDIKDFMLDTSTGKIEYAVLSFGSFLGMGEKLFAVPFKALTLDTQNHRYILDVDKERLKAAPGFDKDNWPDMANPTWAKSIHTYYGSEYQPAKASH